jgi:hypothetical protein
MLASLFALPFLFALSLAAPTPAAAAQDDMLDDDSNPQVTLPTLPLRWRTRFGDSIAAGSSLRLEWHGGDENGYEVYYIPRWPGQLQYDVSNWEVLSAGRLVR